MPVSSGCFYIEIDPFIPQVIETKTEVASDHEDFAYNSLKVSEELLLCAVNYSVAPTAQTNCLNVEIIPNPLILVLAIRGSCSSPSAAWPGVASQLFLFGTTSVLHSPALF